MRDTFRVERDILGRVSVPSGAYYGSFTERAIANFPVSGVRHQDRFIKAYAIIKRSCAIANMRLGDLDRSIGRAIVKACDEIIAGKLRDQFLVDVFQAGAGTSTNMNLNEVIANRANEILHHKKGVYKPIHPNDHVNMSQSTNDTFHAAMHVAAYSAIVEDLLPVIKRYGSVVLKKSNEFSRVIKSARTHLMDAVPITLGQDFRAYTVDKETAALEYTLGYLKFLGIGGTAVGTGLNTDPRFARIATKEISKYTGYGFSVTKNMFAFMQNFTSEGDVSSNLKSLSLKFIKITNDLRLLSSGPYTGLAEIHLPEVQPGSSIMPGKVNPSMPEMFNMVCFQVVGNDLTISLAVQAGQLELNVFGPLIAYNLLQSIEILAHGLDLFTKKCLVGIKPNDIALHYHFEHSAALGTVLSPILGYERTARLVKEAQKRNVTIRQIILERKILTKEQLKNILSPSNITRPNLRIIKRKR